MFSRIPNKNDIIGGAMWFIVLYISVIKTCKFRWCIVISLGFDKRDLKSVNCSLLLIRNALSWTFLIRLLDFLEQNIQTRGQ